MNYPLDLFVQMSELHLFHSMLKLFRSMINVDSLIANQNSEVPTQIDPIQLQVKNLCFNPALKVVEIPVLLNLELDVKVSM